MTDFLFEALNHTDAMLIQLDFIYHAFTCLYTLNHFFLLKLVVDKLKPEHQSFKSIEIQN